MDIDTRQLRYYVAVADELNFTRAARRLHVAQQTLSEAIGQLERHLGVKLLERSTKEVRLTDAGELFRRRANELLVAVEAAVSEARALGRASTSTLKIGTPDWAGGIELFRRAIEDYRSWHGPSALVVDPSPWTQHLEAVVGRRMDVGVTYLPVGVELPDDLVATVLRTEDAGWLFASDGHPLAGCTAVTTSDIAGYPLLFITRRDHAALHDALRARLTALEVAPPLVVPEVELFASALAYALVGDALVWVSASMAANPPSGAVALPIPELAVPLDLVAVTRRDARGDAVEEFIAALIHHAEDRN